MLAARPGRELGANGRGGQALQRQQGDRQVQRLVLEREQQVRQQTVRGRTSFFFRPVQKILRKAISPRIFLRRQRSGAQPAFAADTAARNPSR